MLSGRSRFRRWARRLLVIAGLLLTLAYVLAYSFFNKRQLAQFICDQVNPLIRGRLEIESAEWRPWLIFDLLFARAHRVHVRGFKIINPGGHAAVSLAEGEARIHVMALLFGNYLFLRDIEATGPARVAFDTDLQNGFLASFDPRKPTDAGTPPSSFRLHLDGNLDPITIEVRIGPTPDLAIVLPSAKTPLELDLGGGKVGLRIAPTAAQGALDLLGAHLPLTDVEVKTVGHNPDHPQDLSLDIATSADGATVHLTGAVQDAFAADPKLRLALQIEVARGGAVVRKLGTALLGNLFAFGGPQASGQVQVTGPIDTFTVDTALEGLDVRVAGVAATARDARARLHYDTGDGHLRLRDLGGRLLGGELAFDADFDTLHRQSFSVHVHKLDHIDIGPLLPASQRSLLGGRLAGTGTLAGTFLPLQLQLDDLNLVLRRSEKDDLPPQLHVTGGVHYASGRANLADLRVEALGAQATASGPIALRARPRRLELAVHAQAARLAPLFAQLGFPAGLAAVARSLDASGRLEGTLDQPQGEAQVELSDLGLLDLRIPHVRADVKLEDTLLHVTNVHGSGTAGSVAGQGTIDLSRKVLELMLALRDIDLSRLYAGLSGRAQVDAKVSGPPSALRGSLQLRAPPFALFGDAYEGAAVDATLDGREIQLERLAVRRKGGGSLAGRGRVGYDGSLDLNLDASKFPLTAVPALAKLPLKLEGDVSGQLHLGGSLEEPRPSGRVQIAGARARGILLGDGKLEIVPGGDAIAIHGTFFGRFTVDGSLTLAPSLAMHLSILFQGVPIEQMIPELIKLAELRGVTSGRIDLSLAANAPLHMDIRLSELRLWGEGMDDDGTLRKVGVENDGELRIVHDGVRWRIDPMRLHSAHGDLALGGFLDPVASDLSIRGEVNLELVEYFARSLFDHTHGRAVANLRVTGPMKGPVLAGTVDLDKVMLDPVNFERQISIPSGHLTFTNEMVELSALTFRIEDAQATASGRLDLRDWSALGGHLQVGGRLNAKIIELLPATAEMFADVKGLLDLSIVADGKLRSPNIVGRVQVASPGITLGVRGLGREIKIFEASIELSNRQVWLRNLRGKIDDGDIRLDGTARLSDSFRLADLNLHFQGNELPFRRPQVMSLTLGCNLVISGNAEQLHLGGENGGSGSVEIIEGKYSQHFDNPVKTLLIRPRTFEEDVPIWEGHPLLENMTLDLDVRSRSAFDVDNELAHQVKLQVVLAVTGTLDTPQFDGEIRVQEGAFTLPFIRGEQFVATQGGTLNFFPNKSFPDETPVLNIEAEKTFTDTTGEEHLVRLRFSGALGSPDWDLTTNTGFNKGQTLVLLMTGRPPTELRSALRGDSSGSGSGASDQLAKEATGSALQEMISDPLKGFLRLDALSVYLGPESVDVKGRKRVLNRPRLDITGLESFGILNRTYFEGHAELRLHDWIFLDGQIERFSKGTETEQESLDREKGQLRLRFPLKF